MQHLGEVDPVPEGSCVGGLLQLVDVSNAPFQRPELDAVLDGIKYVRKPQAERHDPFGKSYPIRGKHSP